MKKTPVSSSRQAAVEALCQLAREQVPADRLLDRLSRAKALGQADRQLMVNLVYGVLRQRHYLEEVLQGLCRQPINRLKPRVRQTLLVGLFQLLFLDRIPESAVVNEAVKTIKAAGLPRPLQGLVNAILRNAVRGRADLPDPAGSPGHPFYNHPTWLTRRWQQHYGQTVMEAICAANNQQPPLTLQVFDSPETGKQIRTTLAEAGIATRNGRYSPEALLLENAGRINELPGFSDGLFQVQGEAAQLAGLLLAPVQAGGRYLDACAGAGGKTNALARACRDAKAHLNAVEPDPGRCRRFQDNARRLLPDFEIPLFQKTLQEFAAQEPPPFHGIFLDAPCSGTGVIGRRPDIRWNRREKELGRYQALQLELLDCAAELLTPGGLLVYATCSLEPEENQEVVEQFLARHPDFTLSPCAPWLPPSAQPLLDGPFFAPRPDQGLDGFFAARLVRGQ